MAEAVLSAGDSGHGDDWRRWRQEMLPSADSVELARTRVDKRTLSTQRHVGGVALGFAPETGRFVTRRPVGRTPAHFLMDTIQVQTGE